jgi:hypothetical protein
LKLLVRILGGVTVVAVSFIGTLDILNYWRNNPGPTLSGPTDNQAEQGNFPTNVAGNSPPSNTGLRNIAFALSLDAQSPNWDQATADTTTTTTKEGLLVTSHIPTSGYELTSAKILTAPNVTYVIGYDINVTRGTVAVGVLDISREQKWIMQHPVSQQQDSFQFSAASDSTKIVIFNGGSSPTIATIAKLVVSQN